jgi:DNA-binding CsgD family transcriptional regulator
MQPSVRMTDPPRDLWEPDPARQRLSARELEIAQLIGAGLKDVVIARRLGCSISTVRSHIRTMRFRLGLTSRTALVSWVAERYRPDLPEAGLRRESDVVTSARASRSRVRA